MTTAREDAISYSAAFDQACEERDKIWDLAESLARAAELADGLLSMLGRVYDGSSQHRTIQAALEAWRKESGR